MIRCKKSYIPFALFPSFISSPSVFSSLIFFIFSFLSFIIYFFSFSPLTSFPVSSSQYRLLSLSPLFLSHSPLTASSPLLLLPFPPLFRLRSPRLLPSLPLLFLLSAHPPPPHFTLIFSPSLPPPSFPPTLPSFLSSLPFFPPGLSPPLLFPYLPLLPLPLLHSSFSFLVLLPSQRPLLQPLPPSFLP